MCSDLSMNVDMPWCGVTLSLGHLKSVFASHSVKYIELLVFSLYCFFKPCSYTNERPLVGKLRLRCNYFWVMYKMSKYVLCVTTIAVISRRKNVTNITYK